MLTVAIFRTGGIGDIILSTVALNIIREEVPDAEIHWFGRKPSLDLIKNYFPEIHVHEFPLDATYPQNISIVKDSSLKYDMIIDLQRSARTIIIGYLCSVYFRCDYITWNKFSFIRSSMVLKSFFTKRRIETKSYKLPKRHQAMALCIESALSAKKLYKTGNNKKYIPKLNFNELNNRADAIAINLGALYSSKELPYYKWKTIVEYIKVNNLCKFLYFFGNERNHGEANNLVQLVNDKILSYNYCGKTTLVQAARLLSTFKCTLSIDSALSHLSESVQTPVIVFFGPTHEQFGYRPFLEESRSFSLPLSCRPCTKGGKTSCRFKDFKCFHDLDLTPALQHLSYLSHRNI
jgi:ADP-heptose:LPS heptosyltransferase